MKQNIRWLGCIVALFLTACQCEKSWKASYIDDEVYLDEPEAGGIARRDISGYTVYYIDSRNGNDARDGLSPAAAWRTLNKIYADGLLREGVAILLKRGSVFNEALWDLPGSGSEDRPIVFSDYGEGDLPRIAGSEHLALQLIDKSYWEFSNIHFTSRVQEEKPNIVGVTVRAVNSIVRHIHFNRCTFSDIRGYKDWPLGGTALLVSNAEKNGAGFDDLRVENCTFRNCTRNGFNMFLDVTAFERSQKRNTRVVVKNNLFEGVPGDCILVSGTDGALIEGNIVRFGGELGVGYATPGQLDVKRQNYAAAIWVYHADNSVIRYNISQDSHTMRDGGGFDVDADCENTLIEYNLSYNNSGGFLLICPTDGTPHKNTVVRYNVSIDDGQRNFQRQARTESGLDPVPDASLIQFVKGIESCYIYNNIFVKTHFPVSTAWNDNTAFAFSDGLGVDRPAKIYIANNLLYTTATEKNPLWRTGSGRPLGEGVVCFRNNYIQGYSNRAFGTENGYYNHSNIYRSAADPHPFVAPVGEWAPAMDFLTARTRLKSHPESAVMNAGMTLQALSDIFPPDAAVFPAATTDFWRRDIGAASHIGAYNH